MNLHQVAVVLALAGLSGCVGSRPTDVAKDDASAPGPGFAGPGAAAPSASAKASHPGRKPADQRRVYRLDYTVASIDPGKPVSTSTHTMNLEESTTGEIRVGSNVPLQVNGGNGTAVARQDVGLLIRGTFTPVGDDLLLENNFEMSSADEPPAGTTGATAIRKITMRGDAVVSPGKPALVGSAEDPASHKRMEVTVTATKLR